MRKDYKVNIIWDEKNSKWRFSTKDFPLALESESAENLLKCVKIVCDENLASKNIKEYGLRFTIEMET